MTKTYLISFDDTDNLETLGTGHLLNRFLNTLPFDAGFITRHQLFVSEEVPYTSHNSSMCATISGAVGAGELSGLAARFLSAESAAGSDPGLCIADLDEVNDAETLVEWGLKAKSEVLSKDEAYEVARHCNVHVSEHGGDGQGVVGALAAVGLRFSGNDGRVRGKVAVEEARMTVDKLIEVTGFDRVCACNGVLDGDCIVEVANGEVKAIFRDFARTVLAEPLGNGVYRVLDKQQLKRY